MLAIGNGEKCPFCDALLDNRKDKKGEDIVTHITQKHPNDFLEAMDKDMKSDIFKL